MPKLFHTILSQLQQLGLLEMNLLKSEIRNNNNNYSEGDGLLLTLLSLPARSYIAPVDTSRLPPVM
jgi:hypothetical protein